MKYKMLQKLYKPRKKKLSLKDLEEIESFLEEKMKKLSNKKNSNEDNENEDDKDNDDKSKDNKDKE